MIVNFAGARFIIEGHVDTKETKHHNSEYIASKKTLDNFGDKSSSSEDDYGEEVIKSGSKTEW